MRAELPGVQPARGALARDAADRRRAATRSVGRPRGGVPVVALHRVVLFADDRAVDVMARTAVAAGEAERIGVDEFRFAARHRRAFALVMRRSTRQRCGFGFAAQLDRAFDRQVPRVVEVEVGPGAREATRDRRVRPPVFRRDSGRSPVPCRRWRESTRRRNPPCWRCRGAAHEHRDADALVAVVVDGLDFAWRTVTLCPTRLGDLGFRRRGAARLAASRMAAETRSSSRVATGKRCRCDSAPPRDACGAAARQ